MILYEWRCIKIIKFFLKYWDVVGSSALGMFLIVIVSYKIELIQLISSAIMLMLLILGVFKLLKTRSNKNIVDKLLDNHKVFKTIKIAENPTMQGEELAEITINMIEGGTFKMKNYLNKISKLQGGSFIITAICIILLLATEFIPSIQLKEEIVKIIMYIALGSGATGTLALGKTIIDVTKREEVVQFLIKDFAEKAIKKAETLNYEKGGLTGEAKLTVAKDEIEKNCLKTGTPYNEEEATIAIENILEFSKIINSRDKDKEL